MLRIPIRSISFLCAIFLLGLFAACGGGDGDDDSTPGSAETSGSVTLASTATSDPGTTGTSEGGTTASATPTVQGTATASASPTADASAFTDEERALLGILVSVADLPGEWAQLRQEVPVDTGGPGICGAGAFPGSDEKIAQAEVELQSSDGGRFIVQNLTEFPEEVAIEAMDYARESADCDEFTDESGTVIEIEEVRAPDLGDDAYALRVTFQVGDAGTLEGEFIFVRVGGLVSVLSYLELDNYAPRQAETMATIAVEKMEGAVGETIGLTEAEETLLGALITRDDLPQGWDVFSTPSRSDPAQWTPICDAEIYPGTTDSYGRVSADFYEGLDPENATIQQVITAYSDAVASEAMEYERTSASCTEWDTGQTVVTITPSDPPGTGDDVFAVNFAYDDADRGTVEGQWIVIRVGNLVSNIIYTDPEGIDAEFVEGVIATAAEKMGAAEVTEP